MRFFIFRIEDHVLLETNKNSPPPPTTKNKIKNFVFILSMEKKIKNLCLIFFTPRDDDKRRWCERSKWISRLVQLLSKDLRGTLAANQTGRNRHVLGPLPSGWTGEYSVSYMVGIFLSEKKNNIKWQKYP